MRSVPYMEKERPGRSFDGMRPQHLTGGGSVGASVITGGFWGPLYSHTGVSNNKGYLILGSL